MKNEKNIAFYIPALYKGGSERVLINLAEFFRSKGFFVKLVTDYAVENEYDIPNGIERVVLIDTKTEKFTAFKAIRRFRKFCKTNKIGIVISFLNIYHAVLGTLFSKTKCVISIRNDPQKTYHSALCKIKNFLLFPFADGIVFQTRQAKEYFRFCSGKKSAIIENPIKDVFFEFENKGRPDKIVTFGRLTPQKNQTLLIDAVSDIIGQYPDMTLEIYGDGECRQSLDEHIRQLHLEDRIFLRGQTAHVAQVMEDAGIFVLPSLFEGMPNALMEAMAVGMPCIATDCPCGGSEVLLRDACGILIENNNRDELRKAILSLLEDDDLRHACSENAAKKARQYKSELIFPKWESFLKTL